MTLAHFVYIPAVFLLGAIIGYVLGGRAAEMAKAEVEDKDTRRAARRARRAAEREQDGADAR
ncbi:MAG: hypothetical protein AAF721_32490 [Myxococcota bacterium]